MSEIRLDRARRELDAARVLRDSGFANQAASRAYFATFYAAEEALEALGARRSKHSGVHAAFGALVVKAGGVPAEVGRVLTRLFDLRNAADYLAELIESGVASQAIADAEEFVEAVERWLGERGVSSAG